MSGTTGDRPRRQAESELSRAGSSGCRETRCRDAGPASFSASAGFPFGKFACGGRTAGRAIGCVGRGCGVGVGRGLMAGVDGRAIGFARRGCSVGRRHGRSLRRGRRVAAQERKVER